MTPLLECPVSEAWTDVNGRMNDAAFASVFSQAVDRLKERIGLDKGTRESLRCSLFTLESRISYWHDLYAGGVVHIDLQLLEHDAKRLRIWLVLKDEKGQVCATCEQILSNADLDERKEMPFPGLVAEHIDRLWVAHQPLPDPIDAGRSMSL